ncbi:MAG: twin-arginine translocase TatA/TatE family subunit [Planctomycetes bacterium]|nr:twin-arginine translocase TatA/TatE family subunit [Planctomycetota bacterium]
MSVLFAIFGIGPMEMVIVAVIVLLLFGTRLPSAMRSLGRGVTEFKKGLNENDAEDDEASRKGESGREVSR